MKMGSCPDMQRRKPNNGLWWVITLLALEILSEWDFYGNGVTGGCMAHSRGISVHFLA